MTNVARVLVAALIAALAAATAVHAASAATMSLAMATAEAGSMAAGSTGNCDGCGASGADDDMAACASVCVVPLAIDMTLPATPVLLTSPMGGAVRAFIGRTGPPESRPPRRRIDS